MALTFASLLLLPLYGWFCYYSDIPLVQIQGLSLAIAVLISEFLWNPFYSHDIFRSTTRKSAQAGLGCGMLLVPILVLAHFGENVRVLHTIAVTSSLAQLIISSYKNILASTICVAGIATSLYQLDPCQFVIFGKSALSSLILQAALLIGLKNTLSIGEASILSQLIVLAKYLSSTDALSPIQRLCYAAFVSTCLGSTISALFGSYVSLLNTPVTIIPSIALAFKVLTKFMPLNFDSIKSSLIELFITEGSNTVLGICAFGLVLVLFISYSFYSSEITKDENAKLQMYRKSYHIAALLMFLPAGLYNLPLLQAGLVAAACVFVICETVRSVMKQSWLGSALNDVVSRFITEEEGEGSAIVPHLFLLIGCAIPILISSTANSIHAYAGIFALCVGDASAAISGAFVGDHTWPGSKKTVEGTLIAMAVLYFFMAFITESILFEQPIPELLAVLLYSSVLPIWEASSDQNDNLTLPIVAYAVSKLSF